MKKESLMRSKNASRGLSVASLLVLGLMLTACNPDTGSSASDANTPSGKPSSVSTADGSSAQNSGSAATGSAGSTSSGHSSSSGGSSASNRCTTAELRGNVGDNDPGAGQENFPLVVTNFSDHTCTVDGFPGAAFVDGSGKQLGPDPRRSTAATAKPAKIALAPGKSAWAGLSFGNPEASGAKTATPAGILITPPDELSSLHVDWSNGKVPVDSPATLSPFQAGTGS
ncbi:DUF4232 domain-containing protein [Streptomyces sp. NPDC059629]|uniref:DUF4232 domain-containing protein n=1 Tax=Streptomyces sp. NPDC059629 TaxID=3346889 RepID=UPI00369D25AC